jgi:hypothetical protein
MFHLVKVVHKFDVRLAVNWTNNRQRPVESNRCSTGTHFLTGRRHARFLHKVSSEVWKAKHAAKVKAFFVSRGQYMASSNSCTRILSRHMSNVKHRSVKDALFYPEAPLKQAPTYAAIDSLLRVYDDRQQWTFAFINAGIEESASDRCATMLRRHCQRLLNPVLYIPICSRKYSGRGVRLSTHPM